MSIFIDLLEYVGLFVFIIFIFKQVQLFIRHVNKNFSLKGQGPCHHQTPWIVPSLLLFTSPELGKQWWEGTGTDDSAGAGSRACILLMKLPMLTLARASANKPGQKVSTFTPSAYLYIQICICIFQIIVIFTVNFFNENE